MLAALLLLTLSLLLTPTTPNSPAPWAPTDCRGSSRCKFVGTHFLTIHDFHILLTSGHPYMTGGPAPLDVLYYRGDTIACRVSPLLIGGVCVFLEGAVPMQGVNVEFIVGKLSQMERFGCQLCGSVPLAGGWEGDMGRLVVNYVSPNYCNGICQRGPRGVRAQDIKRGQLGGWAGEWPRFENYTWPDWGKHQPTMTTTTRGKAKPTKAGGKGKHGGHGRD